MKRLHPLLRFDMMDSLTLHPIWVVAGSILGTLPIVSACSLYFHGVVTWDYLITGLIASTIVASFAIGLLNYADARALLLVRESEARFRKLFENSNDAIFIHTVTGEILDANSQAETMMGYPVAVLKTMPVPALHPPEELEASKKAFEETISKGATRFESRFRHSGGALIDVEISARIMDREKGIIQGIVRDISGRKKAEEALRTAHEELLKKSGRLEMFQQVAVNRETRMMEMKDEVNGLLERLGEPRKYVEVDGIEKK